MSVTCQDYLGTLPVLRLTTTLRLTGRYGYEPNDLYNLYFRCYNTNNLHKVECTDQHQLAFMIGMDEKPVKERPWLRDTAKKLLSMLPKDELLEIYGNFRNVITEKHFKKDFHLYAREWMKEVMQFIGHRTSIQDDELVTHMDTDDTVYYGSSMCAACGKQMAID
jgi:hypothetical protein